MAKRNRRSLVAVILAAGMGTRMNSQMPKVLHSVCGTSMIDHVLEALKPLDVKQVYVVTGHLHKMVEEHVGERAHCVLQAKRLGTAHAVKMVVPFLKDFSGDVLVTCGDTPLIKSDSLQGLVRRRRSHHNACTVLTTTLDEPKGYGRVVRNRDGTVRKIVEEKDTNTYEEKIQEINTGFYCFDAKDLLWALERVKNDNAQKEYYLTDTIEILGEAGREVEAHVAPDSREVIGVNSRRDMALAEKYLRTRILNTIMDQGVTIVDPATTYIDNTVKIGIDTTIQPFTIIRGKTAIGEGCEIGPNVTVEDSNIGENVCIRNSVVEEAQIGDNVVIGPYAYVRKGTVLRHNATLGTFVEVARADIGENADVLHLCYLGDADIGDESYIGAGTMTCNFDGASIERTKIGEGVFVGFNAVLRAPVRIHDAARVEPNSMVEGIVKAEDGSKPSTRAARLRSSIGQKEDSIARTRRAAGAKKASSRKSASATKGTPKKAAAKSTKSGPRRRKKDG